MLTKEFAINLAFIENSYLNYAIRWKDDPFGTTSTLSRTLSLKYQPASNCWGVQASWTKGDEQDKFKGSYFFSFYIKFLNNLLGTPNLLSGVEREIS